MTKCGSRAGLALVLLLAACGGDADEDDVSAECDAAMAASAAETNPERADPLIAATVSACSTADE